MPKLFAFLLICTALLPGCKSTDPQMERAYHSITAQEAYDMISQLKDYVIVDVRSESERKAKRIPGSVSIPFRQVKDLAESVLPDKNAMIFVHCRSGGRSTIAAKQLVKLGYLNVYDFKKITKWPGETISD